MNSKRFINDLYFMVDRKNSEYSPLVFVSKKAPAGQTAYSK